MKGTQDQAIIYIALSKNAINVTSRTKTIIPFSPNDNNIFAYGELVIDKSSIPTNEDGILNDYTKWKYGAMFGNCKKVYNQLGCKPNE